MANFKLSLDQRFWPRYRRLLCLIANAIEIGGSGYQSRVLTSGVLGTHEDMPAKVARRNPLRRVSYPIDGQ